MKVFFLSCIIIIGFSFCGVSSSRAGLVVLGIGPVAGTGNCFELEVGITGSDGGITDEIHGYCCVLGGEVGCGGFDEGSGCFLYLPDAPKEWMALLSELMNHRNALRIRGSAFDRNLPVFNKLVFNKRISSCRSSNHQGEYGVRFSSRSSRSLPRSLWYA